MQLKERRMLRQLQKELVIPWEEYLVTEWAQSGRLVKDFEEVALRLGARAAGLEGAPVIVCASLSSAPLTVWGVIMDTQAEKAYLPERRIQKGAALV